MTISQRIHARIALLSLPVAALGGVNWYLEPQSALTWMIALGTMGAIWICVALIERVRPFSAYSDTERGFFVASVTTAAIVITLALMLKLVETLGVQNIAMMERIFGVGMGGVLIVVGNAMPKILAPLTAKRCSPVQAQTLQRFAGWVFVVAGIAYAASWAFLPHGQGGDVATFIGAGAALLVLLRWAWMFLTSARGNGTSSSAPTS